MDKIKAILFDFDDTLAYGPIDGYIPFPLLTQKFNLSEEQISKLREIERPLLLKFYLPEVSMHITNLAQEEEHHHHVYGIMAEEAGIEDKVEFIRFMVNYRMRDLIFGLYPEVVEMISKFKSDYNLHIFTNALPTREREVRSTPIGSLFDQIFISNVVGHYKPQPEFYKVAIETLGLNPSEILLIDDKESLVLEGQKLGMQVTLIDRKNKFTNTTVRRIKSLTELF